MIVNQTKRSFTPAIKIHESDKINSFASRLIRIFQIQKRETEMSVRKINGGWEKREKRREPIYLKQRSNQNLIFQHSATTKRRGRVGKLWTIFLISEIGETKTNFDWKGRKGKWRFAIIFYFFFFYSFLLNKKRRAACGPRYYWNDKR